MTGLIVLQSTINPATVDESIEQYINSDEVAVIYPTDTSDVSDEQVRMVCAGYDVDLVVRHAPDKHSSRVEKVLSFVRERGVTELCLDVTDRTPTGKARIDATAAGIILSSKLDGKLSVGEHVVVLSNLSFLPVNRCKSH
jgi:acetolactate synthase regulatory subunit